jgi:site-specific recombinase XerC
MSKVASILSRICNRPNSQRRREASSPGGQNAQLRGHYPIKQHLAAIRMLFDYLVVGQILAINPAHAVRGPKHSIKRGKTPVLSAAQARQLLDSIDTSTVVGLRDRALIALMTFSFARVGAAVGMRVEDYFADGKRWRLRLNEKGGKVHEMPAHHNLEAYLDAGSE